MATPKKSDIEKLVTKFNALLKDTEAQHNKHEGVLAERMLVKRLLFALRSVAVKVKLDERKIKDYKAENPK